MHQIPSKSLAACGTAGTQTYKYSQLYMKLMPTQQYIQIRKRTFQEYPRTCWYGAKTARSWPKSCDRSSKLGLHIWRTTEQKRLWYYTLLLFCMHSEHWTSRVSLPKSSFQIKHTMRSRDKYRRKPAQLSRLVRLQFPLCVTQLQTRTKAILAFCAPVLCTPGPAVQWLVQRIDPKVYSVEVAFPTYNLLFWTMNKFVFLVLVAPAFLVLSSAEKQTGTKHRMGKRRWYTLFRYSEDGKMCLHGRDTHVHTACGYSGGAKAMYAENEIVFIEHVHKGSGPSEQKQNSQSPSRWLQLSVFTW